MGALGVGGSKIYVVRELPKRATINRRQVGGLWQRSSRRSSFGSVAGGVRNKGKECAKWGRGGEWVCEEGLEGLQGPFMAKDMPDALGPY